MTPVGLAIDAVVRSVDNGIKLAAAERILREEGSAEDQHEKLRAMLVTCATAIAAHPTPRLLCERNEDRLNAQVSASDPTNWPAGMLAAHIAMAAEAFGRAARVLR